MSDCNKSADYIEETNPKEKFIKLFDELKNCSALEQKQKIEEMNGLIPGMNFAELYSIMAKELFNSMEKMFEEKKLSMEDVLELMKNIGCCATLKSIFNSSFCISLLRKRFEKIIVEEEKKKEKNEKLLVDLCECYLMLSQDIFSIEIVVIRVPFLLRVVSKKMENEEKPKEVEMALLALSCIEAQNRIDKKMYLEEIKEIIKYHQEHRSLTRLAYQSAWKFLINRLKHDKNLEEVIVSELHFVGEATRELEELSKCAHLQNTKKNAKECGKVEITRWMKTLFRFVYHSALNEENGLAALTGSVVKLCKEFEDEDKKIFSNGIDLLKEIAFRGGVNAYELLNGEAVDLILKEFSQSTFDDTSTSSCFSMISIIVKSLNRKKNEGKEEDFNETKRVKFKREMFEKLEEDGYEENIIRFKRMKSYLIGSETFEHFFIFC